MKNSYSFPNSDNLYEILKKDMRLLPLKFTYGGKEYSGISPEYFTLLDKTEERTEDKETVTLRYLLGNALEVKILLSHYYSHGATEWTAYFTNLSDCDSEILEDIRAEYRFEGERPVLKGILGDHVNQYRPYEKAVGEEKIKFVSDQGRPTHITFPYFNLECGDGGALLAIGWAGTWKAEFSFDGEATAYCARSAFGFRSYLKKGESVRTALFVALTYGVRKESYATNLWRDWYIKHNLPKADALGNDMKPFSTCCLASDTVLHFSSAREARLILIERN